jgi:hypothetical protein
MNKAEFEKRRKQLAARLQKTQQRDAAIAGAGIDNGDDVFTGQLAKKGVFRSGDHMEGLRKSFENAAQANRSLKHFTTNDAMDNPIRYLRQREKDRNGIERYTVSNAELEALFVTLANKGYGKEGTPFDEWGGPQLSAIQTGFEGAFANKGFSKGVGDLVSKALDTGSSGGPLIRQDLEPIIYEAFLRSFPGLDRVRKIPANGLLHRYNQRTAPGTASLVADVGDLSGIYSNSTFSQQANSNIAIMAAPRSISLKLQYAVAQSGMSYDLIGNDNLEVIGASYAIASLAQALYAQGNYSTAGRTVNDEEGAYSTLGTDGLRTLLKGGSTSLTKAATDTYMGIINRAVGQIGNVGGSLEDLLLMMSYNTKLQVSSELMNFLRVMAGDANGAFPTNLGANGLVTLADWSAKILTIPASSQATGLGYYTYGGSTVEDITVMDPNGQAMAYLGSPTPTVLEMPVAFNNTLAKTYIMFYMAGLVLYIPSFNRKIRVPYVAL